LHKKAEARRQNIWKRGSHGRRNKEESGGVGGTVQLAAWLHAAPPRRNIARRKKLTITIIVDFN
jgi:hypothetical protein